MNDLKGEPYEVCEWCGSTETMWDDGPEYDTDHFPEIRDGRLYVHVGRYCAACGQCYDAVLRFDPRDGYRVNRVGE